MRTNYVLIDYESVQVKSLELLQQPHFKIRVFLGPNNTKLPAELAVAIQRFGDRADYVQLDTPGQNALDFHVAYYLGRLAVEEPDAFFHIISRDKGFDPLIKHLKGKGIFAARSETIEGMPCFKQAVDAAMPSKPRSDDTALRYKHPVDERVLKSVVMDLVKRKAAKPRTKKTLLSTIHAKIGKARSIGEVGSIYEWLLLNGYVKESGDRVSYSLLEPKTELVG